MIETPISFLLVKTLLLNSLIIMGIMAVILLEAAAMYFLIRFLLVKLFK